MTSPDAPLIRCREDLEAQESATLAPYAQRSGESAGRMHAEPRHPYRTEYQRDRARIIHCRAFRRLEYKTQVFLNGTGDHLRTRLTHTIEVASASRSIAKALAVNEDLAEAIALAHDLGHAPFGHSGEAELNRLMREWGGFDHNHQSLRVVRIIEKKYPRFPGLNLSREVLDGLSKHRPARAPGELPSLSLEAQIANLADEITYYSHDLDDGLDHGLITPGQLAQMEVWQHSYEQVRAAFPNLRGPELNGYVIRCIIDRQVRDVISTSAAAIAKSKVKSPGEVRRHPRPLIQYGTELRAANRKLRKFLYANLYYHPAVAGVNRRACTLLRKTFNAYLADPAQLGVNTRRRVRREGLERSVCDYLSGMTDGYLMEAHQRLCGGSA